MRKVKGRNVGLPQQPQMLAKSSFTNIRFPREKKRHRDRAGSGLTAHINVCVLCTYFVMTDDAVTGEAGLSVRDCPGLYACSGKTIICPERPSHRWTAPSPDGNPLRTQWGHSWPNHSGHVHVIRRRLRRSDVWLVQPGVPICEDLHRRKVSEEKTSKPLGNVFDHDFNLCFWTRCLILLGKKKYSKPAKVQ